MTHSYKELIVWQKSIKLVEEIYILTEKFPRNEIFGLTSQMQRAAVSIASNIAEGKMRGKTKEYQHFLLYSYASGAELETQIIICKKLHKTKHLDFSKVDSLLLETMKMLNKLIHKLKTY